MLQSASTTIHKWLAQPWPQMKMDLRIVLVLACGSSAGFLALRWMRKKRIRKQILEARSKRNNGLKEMEKAVSEFKQQNPGIQTTSILSLPLAELAEKLKEGSLSPESVLYTYMEKALTVTQKVNCVRHFIPECEQHLQELKKQKQKGLLYGIPVSIKDHIAYKGHLSTCGFTQSLSELQEEDSVLVKVLKRQGANPFVFTNVPQSLLSYDCGNSIFGQTVNPLDHKRTPGGSSGGEGALIAGGGSILGFGSDLGGSIRLPSSFCGICGFKPTAGRLSNSGIRGPIDGILSVMGTVGPMARNVDSLVLCMRALLCADLFQLDPTLPPMPFNEEVFSSSTPLRVGFFDTDGYFLLPPCMRRAVHTTKKLLQEAGHTLVPFTPPSVHYAIDELFFKGVFADGGSTLSAIFYYYLRHYCTVFQFLCNCSSRFITSLTAVALHIQAYRQSFAAEWKKCKLDVILCPVLGPAFTLGYPAKVLTAISSTMLFNVLNFPAGVVPVTTVTEEDDKELKEYQGLYGDPWDKKLKEAVKGAVGLPVAVQCVALPWQEELCLRFMKEIETLSCKGRQKKAT
uniref:Fatty-acid amide hydrolase 1 n=1 Tax=Anolis carolinensis TaxID=28377 RepID=A0A803TUW1_ANOCA